MALVKCKECGKEVSNKAEICVECGFPLSKKKNGSEEIKTQQKTRKSLKLQLLLSKIMMILGFVLVFGYSQYPPMQDDDKVIIYMCVFVVGIILYVASRVRIWWNHD